MADKDDTARLVHEALEQLGRKGDAGEIASLVKRLDIGLPIEDEFIVLCAWLGQCRLIHKLDQKQMPGASEDQFQVPDLLASFNVDGKEITVLVEVKSSVKNVLSFRPDYMKRLETYADMLRLPLLIAWKWRGIWSLFEPRHCKQLDRNLNISWKTALIQSLLGQLGGDFSYTLETGAGLHIRFQKVEKVASGQNEKQEETQTWNARVDKVYFTDSSGLRIQEVPGPVQSVLAIADFEQRDEVTETHITQHFVAGGNVGLFAHSALVRLLSLRTRGDEAVHWRSHIVDGRVLRSIADFKSAVSAAMKMGFVRYAIHPRPKTKPAFLPKGRSGSPTAYLTRG